MGHPLVQRAADVRRLFAFGSCLRDQSEHPAVRIRLGSLDDSQAEVRHPYEGGLEGVSAARCGEYSVGGLVHRGTMDMSRVTEFLGCWVARWKFSSATEQPSNRATQS